jgi:hypothetical protein
MLWTCKNYRQRRSMRQGMCETCGRAGLGWYLHRLVLPEAELKNFKEGDMIEVILKPADSPAAS